MQEDSKAFNGSAAARAEYKGDVAEGFLSIYGTVKAVHRWDAGEVTTKPTLEKTGVKTYTCACGATKTETIAKLQAVAVPTAKKLTYTGKKLTGVKAGANYTISGNTAKAAGSYKAKLVLKDKVKYAWADGTIKDKNVKWTIAKAANPLKVKAKTATVKFSKVKKANQTLAVSKVIKFAKKGQGAMVYKKVSGNNKIVVNAKTGKVTVKKGLKKGTYSVKVKVKAKGNANYKKSAVKTLTFKVKVA